MSDSEDDEIEPIWDEINGCWRRDQSLVAKQRRRPDVRDATGVSCPTCHAEPGAPCRDSAGAGRTCFKRSVVAHETVAFVASRSNDAPADVDNLGVRALLAMVWTGKVPITDRAWRARVAEKLDRPDPGIDGPGLDKARANEPDWKRLYEKEKKRADEYGSDLHTANGRLGNLLSRFRYVELYVLPHTRVFAVSHSDGCKVCANSGEDCATLALQKALATFDECNVPKGHEAWAPLPAFFNGARTDYPTVEQKTERAFRDGYAFGLEHGSDGHHDEDGAVEKWRVKP